MDGRIFNVMMRAASGNNAGVSAAKKKQGQDCKQKENQRCRNDAAACKALVPSVCENDANCVVAAIRCCEECSANGLLTCLIAATPGASAVAKFL